MLMNFKDVDSYNKMLGHDKILSELADAIAYEDLNKELNKYKSKRHNKCKLFQKIKKKSFKKSR